MRVWVLEDFEHGETDIYPEGTDVLEIPFVKDELSYLVGGYEDERREFILDVVKAIEKGQGSATIEERFTIELKEMK